MLTDSARFTPSGRAEKTRPGVCPSSVSSLWEVLRRSLLARRPDLVLRDETTREPFARCIAAARHHQWTSRGRACRTARTVSSTRAFENRTWPKIATRDFVRVVVAPGRRVVAQLDPTRVLAEFADRVGAFEHLSDRSAALALPPLAVQAAALSR